MDELITFLKSYAGKAASIDDHDFCTYECSGGNYDDAYSIGRDDGEIMFARMLLKKIQKKRE